MNSGRTWRGAARRGAARSGAVRSGAVRRGAALRPARGSLSGDERISRPANPVACGAEQASAGKRLAVDRRTANLARAGGPRHCWAKFSRKQVGPAPLVIFLSLLLCLILSLARPGAAQDAAAPRQAAAAVAAPADGNTPTVAADPAGDASPASAEFPPDDALAPSPTSPPAASLPDVVAETTATLATTSVPLGLVDALGILRAAESLLGASDSLTSAPTPPARIEQAAARVEVVARYMERISEAMREQVRYDWYTVGRMGVKPGVNNSKRIALGAVQRGVQALRVRPAKDDVHLSYVKVEDAQSSHSQTLASDRDLAGDLPKWQVVYLGVPMNVTAVTVTARHSGTDKRSLLVEVGVPRPPDYSREVAALCRQCQALWHDGHDSAEARATLEQAVARLNDFRASLTSIRSRKPASSQ